MVKFIKGLKKIASNLLMHLLLRLMLLILPVLLMSPMLQLRWWLARWQSTVRVLAFFNGQI